MNENKEVDTLRLLQLRKALVWMMLASVASVLPSPAWFVVNAANIVLILVCVRVLRFGAKWSLFCLPMLLAPASGFVLPWDLFRQTSGAIVLFNVIANLLPLLILNRKVTGTLRRRGVAACFMGVVQQPIMRPHVVTAASWLAFASSALAFGLMTAVFYVGDHFGVKTHDKEVVITMWLGTVGGAIGGFSAVAMLKGHKWGRSLFLIAMPALNVLKWLLIGFTYLSLVTVVGYMVLLCMLMSSASSAFFEGNNSPQP